ncbi:MAG TPA: DUF2163 domain-containing protein [Pyrinomonadaceae bacterium]|jgi:uncharacterized phage protein (TIGR02218 family)
MPKSVRYYLSPYGPTDLIAHFGGRGLTPAVCWKLSLVDQAGQLIPGKVYGATSHTSDLELAGHPGVVFKRSGGVKPTVVDTEAGQGSAGLELEAVFDDVDITEEKIAAGDFNSAEFEVFIVNYKALKMGEMIFFSGPLGELNNEGPLFTASARPWSSKANQQVGRLYMAKCDAASDYGGPRCKKDITALTRAGTVTTGGSQDTFRASALAVTFTYQNGKVKWTGGANAGRQMEIKSWDPATKEIVLQLEMAELIQVGDTFVAVEGCDGTKASCVERDNIINFCGYPEIPGIEAANRINRAT